MPGMPGIPCGVWGVFNGIEGAGGLGGASAGPGRFNTSFEYNFYLKVIFTWLFVQCRVQNCPIWLFVLTLHLWRELRVGQNKYRQFGTPKYKRFIVTHSIIHQWYDFGTQENTSPEYLGLCGWISQLVWMNTWASGALGGDIGGGTAVEAATGLTELLQWGG